MNCAGPIDTATNALALLASFNRIASSFVVRGYLRVRKIDTRRPLQLRFDVEVQRLLQQADAVRQALDGQDSRRRRAITTRMISFVPSRI
jgi:hypothetical protein